MGTRPSIHVAIASEVTFRQLVDALRSSGSIRSDEHGAVMYLGLRAVDLGDWADDRIAMDDAVQICEVRRATGQPAAIGAFRANSGEGVSLVVDGPSFSVMLGWKSDPVLWPNWNDLVDAFVRPLVADGIAIEGYSLHLS